MVYLIEVVEWMSFSSWSVTLKIEQPLLLILTRHSCNNGANISYLYSSSIIDFLTLSKLYLLPKQRKIHVLLEVQIVQKIRENGSPILTQGDRLHARRDTFFKAKIYSNSDLPQVEECSNGSPKILKNSRPLPICRPLYIFKYIIRKILIHQTSSSRKPSIVLNKL